MSSQVMDDAGDRMGRDNDLVLARFLVSYQRLDDVFITPQDQKRYFGVAVMCDSIAKVSVTSTSNVDLLQPIVELLQLPHLLAAHKGSRVPRRAQLVQQSFQLLELRFTPPLSRQWMSIGASGGPATVDDVRDEVRNRINEIQHTLKTESSARHTDWAAWSAVMAIEAFMIMSSLSCKQFMLEGDDRKSWVRWRRKAMIRVLGLLVEIAFPLPVPNPEKAIAPRMTFQQLAQLVGNFLINRKSQIEIGPLDVKWFKRSMRQARACLNRKAK